MIRTQTRTYDTGNELARSTIFESGSSFNTSAVATYSQRHNKFPVDSHASGEAYAAWLLKKRRRTLRLLERCSAEMAPFIGHRQKKKAEEHSL